MSIHILFAQRGNMPHATNSSVQFSTASGGLTTYSNKVETASFPFTQQSKAPGRGDKRKVRKRRMRRKKGEKKEKQKRHSKTGRGGPSVCVTGLH